MNRFRHVRRRLSDTGERYPTLRQYLNQGRQGPLMVQLYLSRILTSSHTRAEEIRRVLAG